MSPNEAAFNMASSRIEEQDRRRTHFDTMAWGVLGFGSLLVGPTSFVAGNAELSRLTVVVFGLLVVGYLGTSYCVYQVIRLRGWTLRPVLSQFREHIRSGEYDDNALISWVANEMDRAVNENEPILSDKAHWLVRSYEGFVLLVVLFGFLIGSVIYA